MGFPIGTAVAIARHHVRCADETDARRLERLRIDPAWIADETDPETEARLAEIRDAYAIRRLDRQIAQMRLVAVVGVLALITLAGIAIKTIAAAADAGAFAN